MHDEGDDRDHDDVHAHAHDRGHDDVRDHGVRLDCGDDRDVHHGRDAHGYVHEFHDENLLREHGLHGDDVHHHGVRDGAHRGHGDRHDSGRDDAHGHASNLLRLLRQSTHSCVFRLCRIWLMIRR